MRLDQLESAILHVRTRRSPLVELTKVRRATARLRTRLEAHRPLVHAILHPDFSPAVEEVRADYLVTLEGHYNRAEEAVERARQLIAESFELYASTTAQNTNDLIRALTIVTVAIGVSAALAGVFGMNFDMPLFHTGPVGFLIATGAMLSLALGIIAYARRRDWL